MKKAMFITTSSQEFLSNMHTTALLSPSTAIDEIFKASRFHSREKRSESENGQRETTQIIKTI